MLRRISALIVVMLWVLSPVALASPQVDHDCSDFATQQEAQQTSTVTGTAQPTIPSSWMRTTTT